MPRASGIPRYERQVLAIPESAVLRPDSYRQQQVVDTYANLGKAFMSLGPALDDMIRRREERDLRDAEVQIDTIIRQRKMEVLSSRRGKDADNITQDENAWQLEQRETFLKNTKLNPNLASQLWDHKLNQYLDRIGNYEIEQGLKADEDSKFAYVVNAQNNLAQSNPGNFRAYAEYSKIVDDTYGPQTKEALLAKEKGIDVLIDSWAEQNPHQTLNWFNAHKDQLREVIGREFADVSKAMERVHRKLDAEVARAEVQAARAQRLSEKAEKAKSEAWESEQVLKILNDDPNFDLKAATKDAIAKGIKGDSVLTVHNVFNAHEKVSTSEISGTLHTAWLEKTADHSLTDIENKELTQLLAGGQLTPAHYKSIIAASKSTAKAEEEGLADARKLAINQITAAIAPRGGLDTVNQPAETKKNRVISQLDNYLGTLKTAKEKRDALNLMNEQSYVSQLIQSNAADSTPMTRMRDAISNKPFNPFPIILDPLAPDLQRQPGETPEQWRERTKKK